MSFTPATPVTSPQSGIHKNLEKTVRKHLNNQCLKPISPHNLTAFETAYQWWQQQGKKPAILDSACGTGESSRYLASIYPNHSIIGLDQSIKRLNHSDNNTLPNNCLLLRCECMDFWRLAEQKQWHFAQHTLFYPNPYPKPQHLQRRWHGEAAFSSLRAISQQIELRTNWSIYAQEFAFALSIASPVDDIHRHISLNKYTPKQTVTAFERKYQASQHILWRVLAEPTPY